MEPTSVAEAVDAIRRGQPVILPTDTVYGLCADAYRSEPAERLYRLKGRPRTQPSALLAAEVDGGELPGTPSTVLDFTGAEPRVVREGAVPGAEALERAVAALA